jgi:phosphoinositide-3-kinase regulatory subunit 4
MLKALDMLLYLSLYLTDETNLDRLLPYVVDMLADDSPTVRCAACRALTQVVSPRCAEAWRLKAAQVLLVEHISPSNASIFNDYILPNVKILATDSEPSVRIVFAQCLVSLAEVGKRFISMAGWLRVFDKAKKDRDDLDENDEV